ncbi:MAG: hypothetical protein A2W25_08035 [candidate division Zixibacteria bacterium RBG_16_53_22]|nr:MAG: hypothetical protein A2W25_08035 [candidate division Zixibacteria bacterium RBG_16_53_22]
MRLLKSKRFWGMLLTVALLVYCFYDFNFHQVLAAISQINYWYIIPLIFLEAIIAYIRSLRLKFLIDPVKKIKANDLYPIYCIGMMTNLLMPYLTGQLARIYLLSKKGQLKKTFLFTTTVLEVLFDGMALLGITFVMSMFFVLPDEFRAWHFFVMGGVVIAASLALIFLSRMRNLGARIFQGLSRAMPSAVGRKINDVTHSFFSALEALKSTKHFFLVSTLSVMSWVAQAGLVYLLVVAFGFNITLWGAVIITVIVTIMMIVVLAPANIGTFQAATMAALKPFDVVKAPALAFSFLLHIAVYLPPIILGAFFSFKEGLTLKQLRVEGEKAAEGIGSIETIGQTDGAAESN